MVQAQVERLYKYLQIMALGIALLAPSVYFVGYTYDWGYLDSFMIEPHMFFKAPQEYFGLAYVVFVELMLKLFGAIPDGLIVVICLVVPILAFILFFVRHLWCRSKIRPRLYHRLSNWLLRKRGMVTARFAENVVAPAYLAASFPVFASAIFLCLLLLILSPWIIGFNKGQADAKKLKDEWRPKMCLPEHGMVGCTQLWEAGNVVATGKLVAASEKLVAIFDGSSVQIYSLRNRDIKTILSKQ